MDLLFEHPTYFVLAYLGMLIHILLKLAEIDQQTRKARIGEYIQTNRYSLIASILMIPVLLILATDTSMKDILPLNYLTVTLIGWQTNSIFKAILTYGSAKLKK